MDMLILLGSFFLLMAIGVPIAYSLGLASLAGALWIGIPLDAVMIQIASGVNKFSLLAIPFFVLAGVLPGLLLGLTLAILCLFVARRDNYPKGETIPLRQALRMSVEAIWGLMTMVIILGGILSGVFTANESASIAVIWAFFVTMFVYRDYRWRDLPKLMHRTVKTVTVVMILIGFAAKIGRASCRERGQGAGAE